MELLLCSTLIFFSVIFNCSTAALSSNPPLQKIDLLGILKKESPKKVSIVEIEKFNNQVLVDIFDPYNKDIKTKFQGIYFKDFIDKYSTPEAKFIKVKAIDGYQIKMDIEEIKNEKMILAFKDQNGYLSVDRMGPIRIIYPVKEKISKVLLLKIGVNWIWQLKSLEFVK